MTVRDSPINDLAKHESYLVPPDVNLLPTKRVFDPRIARLRETTKLPKDFVAHDSDVLLKVKIVGVNYKKDFLLLHDKPPVVPGNKVIGKIISGSFPPSHKYLVYPYLTCMVHNPSRPCVNCAHLMANDVPPLSLQSYSVYRKLPCLQTWEYGVTLDGGLQDVMKVRGPTEALVKIPDNVSLHDCCFLSEVMLPLYSVIKDTLLHLHHVEDKTRVLVVLNDVTKEINDVLIVLKNFHIDQKHYWFIDPTKIAQLLPLERANYKSKFHHVLLFACSDQAVTFGMASSISTGLESTRLRYNIFLFNQYDPESQAKNKYLQSNHTDKTIHHFKLTFADRQNALELLNILSELNRIDLPLPPGQRPSVTSIESASTFSNTLVTSASTSTTNVSAKTHNSAGRKPPKALRFRDDESIIDDQKKQSYYSWLHFDKDFDLCNDYDLSDDDEDDRTHTVRDINANLVDPRYSRVCYANKANKPVKINAFIFT